MPIWAQSLPGPRRSRPLKCAWTESCDLDGFPNDLASMGVLIAKFEAFFCSEFDFPGFDEAMVRLIRCAQVITLDCVKAEKKKSGGFIFAF